MTSSRIFAAAAVSVILALGPTQANAGKCVSNGTLVIKDTKDGSECRADSDGSNKATAKATGNSFAEAVLDTGGQSNPIATKKGVAHSTSHSGGIAKSKASKNSDASSVASSSGTATATASNNANEGNDGGARAVTGAACSSTANAKGTGGGFGANAEADCSVGAWSRQPRPTEALRLAPTQILPTANRDRGRRW